jgi:predicted amidohydrolase
MDSKLGAIEHNVNRMQDFARQAREKSVDLLVFPELCVTGYALGRIDHDTALSVHSAALQPLLEASHHLAIAFGFQEGDNLRTYNSVAFCEAGRVVHVHRKLYLPTYGTFEERKHFAPGQDVRAFSSALGPMAMLVCYDAWQPVAPFLAVQDGAKTLLLPACSAERGDLSEIDPIDYWQNIIRFHARMGESFVVFVNRVGLEDGVNFFGRSTILDPAGEVVAEAPAYEEALITADIDFDQVRRMRRRTPLVKEARLAMLRRQLERLAQAGGDL